MIYLTLLLLALGVADLFRSRDCAVNRRQLALSSVPSFVVLALTVWGMGLGWAGVAALMAISAWTVIWTSWTASRRFGPSNRPWPLIFLGLSGLLALSLPQPDLDAGWLLSWYHSLRIPALATVDPGVFFFVVAVLLFQIASANIVVRMVLTGTGERVMASERTLKGGRILGPIERLFIVSMAIGGQYSAVGAVIAAKSIMRFPEISRDDASGLKAEYVLVGSFVSWATALIFVPLIH